MLVILMACRLTRALNRGGSCCYSQVQTFNCVKSEDRVWKAESSDHSGTRNVSQDRHAVYPQTITVRKNDSPYCIYVQCGRIGNLLTTLCHIQSLILRKSDVRSICYETRGCYDEIIGTDQF
jgi:hypothetical protein